MPPVFITVKTGGMHFPAETAVDCRMVVDMTETGRYVR